jgi:peptide deformylase
MLKVVEYPNPVLSTPCDDVTTFDGELKQLVAEMAEAMYVAQGVGLAAPQVNLTRRLILVDPSGGEKSSELLALINPVIAWRSAELEVSEEGCLSLPGIRLQIPRPLAVQVNYVDVDGKEQRRLFKKMWARIVQHEMDHLTGTLMVDKVGSLARRLALKNLTHNG